MGTDQGERCFLKDGAERFASERTVRHQTIVSGEPNFADGFGIRHAVIPRVKILISPYFADISRLNQKRSQFHNPHATFLYFPNGDRLRDRLLRNGVPHQLSKVQAARQAAALTEFRTKLWLPRLPHLAITSAARSGYRRSVVVGCHGPGVE